MKAAKYLYLMLACFFSMACTCKNNYDFILLEAESFDQQGGWFIDTQSIEEMGSSYLLAHGMGRPVENASTSFYCPEEGTYTIWVRTKDWVQRWNEKGVPGRFEVFLNGQRVNQTFGTEDASWHWQNGGDVFLQAGSNKMEIHDLTGFEGRCDAICFSKDGTCPPEQKKDLEMFRREFSGQKTPEVKGNYDLVVVGGGIAGCCAALSAARLGCKVALVQNRAILGGNNSSEVRVGLSGLIAQAPYRNLGNLMDELGGVGHWNYVEAQQDRTSERSQQIMEIIAKSPEKLQHNAGPASNYEDDKKIELILQEKNIDLFLNTHITKVKCRRQNIVSVIGTNVVTKIEYEFKGNMFSDCTGDGTVGFLAGADYRMGRESKQETKEPRAPEVADSLVMGTSVQWYAGHSDTATSFPVCDWALDFTDESCFPITRGDWDWEVGLNKNQITQIEEIRDFALRSVYGNWSHLKNSPKYQEKFANMKLEWVAYIGGKRESRRLLGDVILKEQDILEQKQFEDASFTTTWGMDLHYPKQVEGNQEEPFLTYCDVQDIKPFAVPYRCLYSRNIKNLFMAGRNISVTHVVLGTVRVMRTGGMMGEVVGMAAAICKDKRTNPRGVYDEYLDELKRLMEKGIGKSGFSQN